MRERRPRRAAQMVMIVVGLLLGSAPISAEARADGWPRWTATPGGVFRTGEYRSGEWVYTNGIGQALGANSDGLNRTDYYRAFYPAPGDPTYDTRDVYNALTYDFFGAHRATHNGDYQLPTDTVRWPYGTADLAEVRLAADSRNLYVRFLWNSFPRVDAQIATLTFAAAGAVTPERAWPRNARLSSGWQAALTLWGTGGSVATGPGQETPVAVRAGDHFTEARIPLSLLPAGPWRLGGGAGLQDPSGNGTYWEVPPGNAGAGSPGSGGPLSPTNAWDLLFAGDHPWSFDELAQSSLLMGGSPGAASATVDPALLRSRASVGTPIQTGDLSRMFASRLATKDGFVDQPGVGADTAPPAGFTPPLPTAGFDRTYRYTGHLQWYGMHVPQRYPASRGAWPLIVYLHGFTGLPDEAFYNPVGLVSEADRRGYLVATPLGRGDYFYRGEGDLDVLEVIRDVQRHYHVDPNRIYLMGHSMGGYGTNNVAMHHPDLFAAVAPAEGTDSIGLSANLRNVPWFEMSAIEDLDTMAVEAKKLYAGLSTAGYDARLLVYATKIHEYSSIYDTLPQLFSFFGAHRRVADPAVVSWTIPVGQDRPDLGLRYDGAYWVDGVKAAHPGSGTPPTVTVTSSAIPHMQRDPARAVRSDTMVDLMGPTGRSRAEQFTTTPARGFPARRGNTLSLLATGISALSVDAAGARLRLGAGHELQVRSVSDHPVTLHIGGLPQGSGRLRVDGRASGRWLVRRGALALRLPSGTHTLRLSGRR